MPWLAQAGTVSVESFTQYGILGLLGVVILILVGLVSRLVLKSDARSEVQTKNFLDFAKEHRGELGKAMETLGEAVTHSTDKLAGAIASSHHEMSSVLDKQTVVLERQARLLDETLRLQTFMERIKELKSNGTPLTQEDIDKAYRTVVEQRRSVRGE